MLPFDGAGHGAGDQADIVMSGRRFPKCRHKHEMIARQPGTAFGILQENGAGLIMTKNR